MCFATLCHYLSENVKFQREPLILVLVIFPQNFFFVLTPNFDIYAEIRQKKMLNIQVVVWHHTYLLSSSTL